MSGMLPQVFVITQSGRYLRHTNEFVDISETNVFDTMCRVAAEPAKSSRSYFHLRFLHTNRYWAKQESGSFFIATSKQPEEDESKPSCTLFRLIPCEDGMFSFNHIQTLGILAAPSPSEGTSHCNLFREGQSEEQTMFRYIDWDTLIILPKYVAFKGDNDQYLRVRWLQGYRYLQFSAADHSDTDAGFEVTMTRDGHVRIKSISFGLFWRRSPNWIWADSNDSVGNDKDTLFWPVKESSNVLALRNAGNGAFCKRLTADRKSDALNAGVYSITREAKLILEELVSEQEVFDVRYHLDDARIYDEQPMLRGIQTAVNESNVVESSKTLTVGFEDEQTYNLTNSLSISLGASITFKAGLPFIAGAEIEVSTEVTTSFEWSSGWSKKQLVSASYTTDVPPRSRVKITYVSTQGRCDVPFSYRLKQRLVRDGSVVITNHDDGLYHGVNSYNFHFLQREVEPLP